MRLALVCGTHPRHLFVANKIIESGFVAGIVIMKREDMVDDSPTEMKGHLRDLYLHHFELRASMEEKYFGNMIPEDIKKCDIPVLEIERSLLNSEKVEQFIKSVGADCLFSYGPDLFKENIIDCVGGLAMNLHGGLSPWYKGAATMFWPFYFLEPNYVGTTLHYITKKIDAGNIIHQTVPELEYGDCMHEVACKAIVKAAEEICLVIKKIDREGWPKGESQKASGKLFLERNWRPEHLQLVYDLYGDKIVDRYLDGEINLNNAPHLIRFI